ncbi:MAG: hypothetical protein M3437_09565 [Chloroflexota bacterium]|nr:hypothetical protein [Chloroflexota bacterium]MDQ5866652.1 hypothetical protein [Chloroflexota bacterium]
MDNEQPRDDIETVQRDRRERGETRDAHLELAREQARKANAEARGRNEAEGGDEARSNDEAQSTTRIGTDEATMKAQARARYDGTDEDFEQGWPAIREQLASEDMQKGMERIRRRF